MIRIPAEMDLVGQRLMLLGALGLLFLHGCSDKQSHCLTIFYTLLSEPDQRWPQFVANAYVDDQLIGFYNSNVKEVSPAVPWVKEVEIEDPTFWKWNTKRAQEAEEIFRNDLRILQRRYNQTEDALVAKVTRKTISDEKETLVCQVYGFYPKEISTSWKRNGEDWEHETSRGAITPNSDKTYHAWLSVETDSKDRNRFRCHVEHSSLPETLILAWEESGKPLNTSVIQVQLLMQRR